MTDPAQPMRSYTICLADFEPVLPTIARILGAKYRAGSLTELDDRFKRLGRAHLDWWIAGPGGRLTVHLEQYDDYYFGTLEAAGPAFDVARALLREHCIAQGGNPDA